MNSLFFLIMAIFPLIAVDFLPTSLIAIFISLVALRIYTHLPNFLIFILIGFSVYHVNSIFGSRILPESTISILALMIIAKFLQPRSNQDKSSRILGLLWIGVFVIFRSDMLSVILSLAAFAIIIKTLPHHNDKKVSLKDIISLNTFNIKEALIGLSIVVLLFIFFPRIHGFFPSVKNQSIGQIGYSKMIDNSSRSSLQPSSQIAFIAEIKEMTNDQLYWRGRVLSITDGYNWRSDQLFNRKYKSNDTDSAGSDADIINYKIKYEQDFGGDIILLDTPSKILNSNQSAYRDRESNTFKTYSKKKKIYVEAQSKLNIKTSSYDHNNTSAYTKLPPHITNATDALFDKLKRHTDLSDLLSKFHLYLLREKFTYTLNPKDVTTLRKFLTRKEGFCTHYASLLGIVLRHFKYPTRLISGFQGGKYNSIGAHYTVSSNDAHAWVEVYNNKRWLRVDPTSFIAPSRIMKGGEEFLASSLILQNMNKSSTLYKSLIKIKQYWDNLNYKVSLFLDTYDREKQNNIAKKLNIKRITLLILAFFIIAIIFTLLYLSKPFSKNNKNLIDKLFNQYAKKLKKHQVLINNFDDLYQIQQKVLSSQLEAVDKDKYIDFIKVYQKSKYSTEKEYDLLKSLVKELN